MRFRSIVIATTACVLALAGVSFAVSQERQRSSSKTTVRSSTEVRRISTVVGGKFVVSGGATFGKIEDIVINDAGCIDFVVIVHEDHFIPVPWAMVHVDFAANVISVDFTRDRLLEAPSFAGWAEFSKTEWREKVTKHFGSESRRERRGDVKDRDDRGRGERRDERGKTDSKDDRKERPKTKKGEPPRDRDDKDSKSDEKPAPKKSDEKKSNEKQSGEKEKPDKKPDEKEKPQ